MSETYLERLRRKNQEETCYAGTAKTDKTNLVSLVSSPIGQKSSIENAEAANDAGGPRLPDLDPSCREAGERSLRALPSARSTPAPRSPAPAEVGFSPVATFETVTEELYPDSIASKPFELERTLTDPLSESEEHSIRAWLGHIWEREPAIIDHVLEQCRRDPEARCYFLGHAAKLPRPDDSDHRPGLERWPGLMRQGDDHENA